jgi:hypothetical protein
MVSETGKKKEARHTFMEKNIPLPFFNLVIQQCGLFRKGKLTASFLFTFQFLA